jgi:transposase InsO family protein
MPTKTPADWEQLIRQLRESRKTGAQIAAALKLPRSTVARVLGRLGLSRLPPLEPPPPIQRYEWPDPGDLLHIDIKKLARFRKPGHRVTNDRTDNNRKVGWELVYVCIDDATRVAYVEVLPDEKNVSSVAFLQRAVAWFSAQGIKTRRVMTDNGTCFKNAFSAVCSALGARHIKTRPYTPRTNGKAERFIQTMLREWAYVRPYRSSDFRNAVLSRWLLFYNRQRLHGSLGMTPLDRLRSAA